MVQQGAQMCRQLGRKVDAGQRREGFAFGDQPGTAGFAVRNGASHVVCCLKGFLETVQDLYAGVTGLKARAPGPFSACTHGVPVIAKDVTS